MDPPSSKTLVKMYTTSNPWKGGRTVRCLTSQKSSHNNNVVCVAGDLSTMLVTILANIIEHGVEDVSRCYPSQLYSTCRAYFRIGRCCPSVNYK